MFHAPLRAWDSATGAMLLDAEERADDAKREADEMAIQIAQRLRDLGIDPDA